MARLASICKHAPRPITLLGVTAAKCKLCGTLLEHPDLNAPPKHSDDELFPAVRRYLDDMRAKPCR